MKTSAVSKLAIQYVDPKKLRASSRNARTHSNKQVEQIAGAIRDFGFTNPILTDERHSIIAGHGRHAAAVSLKLKQVPVIVLNGLSKTKRRALALADNRIALNSGWDDELLAEELGDLQDADGMDLTALGFTDKELKRLLGSADEAAVNGVDYKESFAVIVEVDSEQKQTKLLERLSKEGYRCKALIA